MLYTTTTDVAMDGRDGPTEGGGQDSNGESGHRETAAEPSEHSFHSIRRQVSEAWMDPLNVRSMQTARRKPTAVLSIFYVGHVLPLFVGTEVKIVTFQGSK